jgi:hypothetical protein
MKKKSKQNSTLRVKKNVKFKTMQKTKKGVEKAEAL